MQIEFQATEDDYKRFLYAYFFKRNLAKRLALLIIFSLWIGSLREGGRPFIFTSFLIKAAVASLILFAFFILTPYLIGKVNFNKAIKANLLPKHKAIVTSDEGITIVTDNESTFWKWEVLLSAEIANGYLYISLFTNQFYLIPLKAFSNDNEAINFLGIVKSNIRKVSGENKFRKVRNLYYWGLVGFIPNVGVITGIILYIKGYQYNKIGLILVGVADILFTAFFWMVLFPLLSPNGFKDISQMQLNSLIKNVEFYKLQYGQYPDSLQQLLKDDKLVPINDAIQQDKNRKYTYYNYEKIGDKYLLFSSGLDGIPNTLDDLYPVFYSNDSSKIGFIKSK